MKILVIGSGGREHALVWKIAQSPLVGKIYCAPGNPGIGCIAENVPLKVDDLHGLLAFARKEGIGLTVVGPELPLSLGIVDLFEEHGLKIFGARRNAALIEASKAFSKDIMKKYGVPTAFYEVFTEVEPAVAFIEQHGAPIVVKADGLAAGKGVVVAQSKEEAVFAVKEMLSGSAFGAAGSRVVVEEFLRGEEASFLAFTDGKNIIPLASAQDHKAIFDGDKGPNTGGMGAYSPAPVVMPNVHARAMHEIILPTLAGMAADGMPFTGFLYAGLMIDAQGQPRTVEFNARLGDPETQPILMRLKSDLLEALLHATDGTLDQVQLEWDRRVALGVVVAAAGYPMNPRRGDAIGGLPPPAEDLQVFHAGTAFQDGRLVTSGGRVLCVTALGEKVKTAQQRAYEALRGIHIDGAIYRTDIGHRALRR